MQQKVIDDICIILYYIYNIRIKQQTGGRTLLTFALRHSYQSSIEKSRALSENARSKVYIARVKTTSQEEPERMTNQPLRSNSDPLETLEQVKKQYQQYIEISKIFDLPIQKKPEQPQVSLATTNALTFST